MSGKRLFLTGAAGYIGGKTAKELCEKPWVESLVGTDINPSNFKHPKFTFIKRDIRDSFDDVFQKEKIDTILHMAYALKPVHDKNWMEDVNKTGTQNMLDAAVRHGVKHVLYTSSTTAYGFHPDNDYPLTEESPLRGNNDFTYAKNKKEIEAVIREFEKEHPEIIMTVVRPCFVVGPGFNNVLAEHLKKKIVILPSNSCEFQFVHEDDLINVMALLLEQEKPGIYNVVAEGTMSFKEMVKMLGNIRLPIPFPILYPLNAMGWFMRMHFLTRFPSPSMRMMVHAWIASGEKLAKEIGYKFKYDTRQGFADFARSVRNSK